MELTSHWSSRFSMTCLSMVNWSSLPEIYLVQTSNGVIIYDWTAVKHWQSVALFLNEKWFWKKEKYLSFKNSHFIFGLLICCCADSWNKYFLKEIDYQGWRASLTKAKQQVKEFNDIPWWFYLTACLGVLSFGSLSFP